MSTTTPCPAVVELTCTPPSDETTTADVAAVTFAPSYKPGMSVTVDVANAIGIVDTTLPAP